ncbi:hypothetical protein AN9197.2 [Aspergillus nidulans FGSC A4]|uniref:BTB domain-containing protein n=1 Tax=Emericella nidulans (strain FGSC A4 / ATCC 38163 / CBS 112.46 / NRRL 194 / M139) TaxID=227321 RepID=Q5AR83_EMENI|nr:hypothetical protein [Aspergillus nidulans FGSC A4]EAA61488.1 hypothetical protein AN9197.2 [Aspergillus nidulans FGSC A4]CBF82344.1 TPA: conserved hypothetical protein [Aspergillus nidulans FGSC A4]|eukprot:XP_682466.1 hypothetical protein AN9197.2 [Aspergillus nidulans FGSC A4]
MAKKKDKRKRPSEPEAINEEPMPTESIAEFIAEPEPPEAEPVEAQLSELPGIEYNQPASSPYEYPIAIVKIGRKSYGIPAYYIRCIPQIKCEFEWHPLGSVSLTDVDEDIGHTFVHFLYTGQYETLYSNCDRVREYRRSVFAYQAARKYGLPVLEALAKRYIEHFSEFTPLENILGTAVDVFTKLPHDEVWFQRYLRGYFVQSYRENMHFFHRDEFTKSTGMCPPLDRIILQLTVDILSSRIAELESTIEQANELKPETEFESLPEPAPEPETDIAAKSAPEPESSAPTRASDYDAESSANYVEPADLGYSEEAASFPVPEEPGKPETCDLPECTAESSVEVDPPAATFSPAQPHLETYGNGDVSPGARSPVELGPVAENAQGKYPSQEYPVPEPVPSDTSDGLYGSTSKMKKKKGKNKKKNRPMVPPPPVPIIWS